MIRATSLIRIRFPFDLVDRLDRLAERLRPKGRKIPRAALVRALVHLHMRTADDYREELMDELAADPVKRGRDKGPQIRRSAPVQRSQRSGGRSYPVGRRATAP